MFQNKRLNDSVLVRRELVVARREREVEAQRNVTQMDTDISTHEHLAHLFLKSALHHADIAVELKKGKKAIEAQSVNNSNILHVLQEIDHIVDDESVE